MTDKAKEKWISNRCKEIDNLQKAGRSDLSYKVIKELAGINTKRRKGKHAIYNK